MVRAQSISRYHFFICWLKPNQPLRKSFMVLEGEEEQADIMFCLFLPTDNTATIQDERLKRSVYNST